MPDINQINAMSPEQRATYIRKTEKKIVAHFALLFGLKIAMLVGLSLVVRAYSKKIDA